MYVICHVNTQASNISTGLHDIMDLISTQVIVIFHLSIFVVESVRVKIMKRKSKRGRMRQLF
jgi:hypothetical protein